MRKLCVDQRHWLSPEEFEDGIAAANLLPGPASTQLMIYCAWRLGGPAGALIGGACFIVPGLIVILGLAVLFLASRPPTWVEGAAAGAGAAVPAVAVSAALGLVPASWRRATSGSGGAAGNDSGANAQNAGTRHLPRIDFRSAGLRLSGIGWPAWRWVCYLLAGGVVAALAGPFLVLLLAGCGLLEMYLRESPGRPAKSGRIAAMLPVAIAGPLTAGVLLSVVWVAFKVGALSYGGGFVIIPLMQHDAVSNYHWMTGAQFLSAVALGQVTPGPVVQTVAVVGYAAAGIGGGLLASLVAFTPSFVFVLAGASRFGMLRRSARVQAFLTGAGPAAIGAIGGATIPLAMALAHLWQFAVLALAAAWLLALRKNVVAAIVGAAFLGVIAVLSGAPVG